MKYFTLYSVRHSIATGVAILIAVFAMQFSFTKEAWVLLGAFLVTQTTRGTPLRQSLILFLTISTAMLFCAIIFTYVTQLPYQMLIIASVFIITTFLTYLLQPLSYNAFLCLIYIAIITMVATFIQPQAATFLNDRLLDISLGSFLGMVCAQFIFPIKLVKEFGEGVIPLLQALLEYTQAWSNYFAKEGNDLRLVNKKKQMLEETLQEHRGVYPLWVYEVGFNPGLRSGFRFFLVNLEKVVEVCFSLDYWGGYIAESNLPDALAEAIAAAMQNNQELISILLDYFSQKKLLETQSDFTSDIAALENALRQIVPDNIEVLELSDNYLLLTALARDIKDLRTLLLQLVMALPTTE